MSRITIVDLEVFYSVGVTDAERAKPQRLLVSVEMEYDFTSAILSDRVDRTINYFDVAQEILTFGERRSWRLIEKLAANLGDMILAKFKPENVAVEVKKFPIPQAQYVSASLTRTRAQF